MCMYCERKVGVAFFWKQPQLPYHNQKDISANLSGNVLENKKWNGFIYDCLKAHPELILTCHGYFNGEGIGTICIPIKYCPECGRRLGKKNEKSKFSIQEDKIMMLNLENVKDNIEKLIEKYSLCCSNHHYLLDEDLEELFYNSGIKVGDTLFKAKNWNRNNDTGELIGCKENDYIETIELFQNEKRYLCQVFAEWTGCCLDYMLALENL